MADDKIVARVQKLLRLAAPSSGTSQAERESAALEAARLIAEHGIAIGAPPPAPPPRRPPPRAPRPQEGRRGPPPPAYQPAPFSFYGPSYSDWSRAIATRVGICVDPTCGGEITPGDAVWQRRIGNVVEYLHADGPCRW